MKPGREERPRPRYRPLSAPLMGAPLAVLACVPPAPSTVEEASPAGDREVGPLGDRRVVDLAAKSKTLNPALGVCPKVRLGARKGLGNCRPAILNHHALRKLEEQFWRSKGS